MAVPAAAPSIEGMHAETMGFPAGSVTLEVNPALQIVGQESTFYVNATSNISGATLTVTIFYDESEVFSNNTAGGFSVNTTGNPGLVVQKHTYHEVGNFTDTTPTNPFHWVFVFVNDGSTNDSISMKVYTNEPPWLYYVDAPIYPSPGPSGWFYDEYVLFVDNNSDMVNVTWDWGDGTSSSQLLQGLPLGSGGVTTNSSHSWSNDTIKIPGMGPYYVNFTMYISLSDGVNPAVVFPVNVSIQFPNNVPPEFISTLSSSTRTTAPDRQVNFSASASDYEGEAFTWTFDYGDGSLEVFHTGATTSNAIVVQDASHQFVAPGNYTVTLYLSDSVPPYQTGSLNISSSVTVDVIANHIPTIFNITATPTDHPKINATLGYVNVTFQFDCWDVDKDTLTITWDLAGIARTNETNGTQATIRQARQFTDTGQYNVTVTVTDGFPGHEVMLNLTVYVSSDNRPPSAFLDFKYGAGDFGSPNETINFTLVITDLEHDVIEVSWDFGDGSPVQFFNLTDYAGDNTTLVVSHKYVEQKTYNMTILFTDNKVGYLNHSGEVRQPVVIFVPPPKVVIRWDWWDYATLSLFALIPVLLVVRMVMIGRRRRRLEDEGISMEEAKLRKELHLDKLQPHEPTHSEKDPGLQDTMSKEEEL